ncbi:MAG TPA: beta-ketoacyl synthase chain length factor [Steroidobacteraceae bacterium]|nr:beta-ketoacyl synthase chain length factor [Steroidobacteraceae bacterium]
MTPLIASLQGVGVLGPGFDNWACTAAILRHEAAYQALATLLPAPGVLPSAERRRAGRIIKLALAVGAEALAQAGADARTLPTVFSSSGGDGDNCHEICMTLASEDRQISPTRFHNSVHNAASGYWSIAYGCTRPSTSLCAGDASFGAGLLEAMAQLACGAESVMVLAYDADYPQPLRATRAIPDAFAIALLLAPAQSERALAQLQLELVGESPTTLNDPQLEALRLSIPAARGLPLLESLALRRAAVVYLDYLDSTRLAIGVSV